MSEATTENPTPEPTEEATEQGNPAEEAALGDAGKKALDRMKAERNEAKQQAAALQAQLDEFKRANETELERAQREAAEARAEIEKVPSLVADQLRDHLAEIHKFSDEQRELYLTSNDPSVLLKQAMGLVDRTPTGPKPDLSQGGNGATPHALNSNGLEDALKTKLGIR